MQITGSWRNRRAPARLREDPGKPWENGGALPAEQSVSERPRRAEQRLRPRNTPEKRDLLAAHLSSPGQAANLPPASAPVGPVAESAMPVGRRRSRYMPQVEEEANTEQLRPCSSAPDLASKPPRRKLLPNLGPRTAAPAVATTLETPFGLSPRQHHARPLGGGASKMVPRQGAPTAPKQALNLVAGVPHWHLAEHIAIITIIIIIILQH